MENPLEAPNLNNINLLIQYMMQHVVCHGYHSLDSLRTTRRGRGKSCISSMVAMAAGDILHEVHAEAEERAEHIIKHNII